MTFMRKSVELFDDTSLHVVRHFFFGVDEDGLVGFGIVEHDGSFVGVEKGLIHSGVGDKSFMDGLCQPSKRCLVGER